MHAVDVDEAGSPRSNGVSNGCNGPAKTSSLPTTSQNGSQPNNTHDTVVEAQPGEVAGLRDTDLEQLWQWNKVIPAVIPICMHDIISEKARQQPDVVAVQSWDGTLTYSELEELSAKLARQLRHRGVETGSRIPLCFEKSMWAVVSLLGVMRAGATFSLTDPSQPEARLRTIVEQTGAELIITSVAQSELGKLISGNARVLAVSRDYFDQTQDVPEEPLPTVPTTTPMYIIFTSGSTGKPKGVVLSHENYTSGAVPRAGAVGYNSTSRVFDFPSYAFDVSIDCMLCTLASGGRVCVPSEEARMNDLSGAIRDSKANMVHMTPSVARVLDADIIPSLDALGLGGEAVSASDAATWSQCTSLVIAYGPSECTVGCTINNTVTISTGIGKGVGGTTWIVDPENHDRLMPIGAVGELLVEGPVVGIGYLDEPEKTAEVFIQDPAWLVAGHNSVPGRAGRLYKTGDLVRYEANGSGSIEFVGRKDQQVKLRGQRVELAEVEHHLRSCLPSGLKVAAEVIKPEIGAPTLVAFISEPTASSKGSAVSDSLLVEPSPELALALSTVDATMGAKVPRYMVPAAFITIQDMPSLVSGKTDRKKLREIGCSIPREKLNRTHNDETQNEEPQTDAEKLLQQAWMKVLGQEAQIYRQSNFFGLGGDSLRAMRLVAAARQEGLALTVADVFTNPALDVMALKTTPISETPQEAIPPFSLLDNTWSAESACKDAAALSGLEVEDVEDVYPCTPLQEALMALSAKVKEAYVAQRVVELQDAATAERLIAAFEVAQKGCPILRTRIVQVPRRGLFQVVVKGNLNVHSSSNLDEYLHADRDEAMELGKRLVRYAIINDDATNKISFVLTMHHALYDGWSMPLVVERVNAAYLQDAKLSRPAEFKHFIKYLGGMDRTESESYWREQLLGANGPQFPSLPWQGYQTQADSLLEVYVPLEHAPASNVTIATVIKAAWALVVSQYINSSDVIFGETLTGRNAPIVGTEEIEGPMITTVPVRIQAVRDISIGEYLQVIQEQTVSQIPHEHLGLQHIRKLSPDALEACELRTGLVLHPSAENDTDLDQDLPANRLVPAGDSEAAQEALKFNTYAVMLVCSIDPKGFLVMASFDSMAVGGVMLQRMLEQFRQVAQKMCGNADTYLGDVSCITEADVNELRRLSSTSRDDPALKGFTGAEAAYIVDPRDSTRLLPVGAAGELLVQSTTELALPEVAPTSWLSPLLSGQTHSTRGKLYKTGKTAKFDSDGHISFITAAAAKQHINPGKQPVPTKRAPAASQKQRKLRTLWSRVLHLKEDDISLNDSFFLLGGDSIAAMKLVSEARLEGVKLTVVQMFQKRTLYDMASVMEETDVSIQTVEVAPAFSLLDVKDNAEFVESVVRPQLADQSWKITNVLPTRPLQQIAVRGTTQLPRFSTRYELMYFDHAVNRERLIQSCQELVTRNEILRTVFVEHNSQGSGVVVEDLRPSVVEYAVEDDVEGFAKQLCRLDVLTRMPLGSCFVKWFLIEASSGQSCLVFRLSHAQYDEICLPILLRQLSSLYEGKPVQETIPFSSYVGYVVRENIPKSITYWKDLLAGSSMTILKPDIPVQRSNHFAIQKALDISSRSKDVTIATLPTAAWALCLARRLSMRDVTFGEVVSGRNIDFSNADTVVGPCWQYVPVRVAFQPNWTVTDLLNHIQHQHVSTSAHEGISLSEIIANCTDWSSSTSTPTPEWFDSVVHQDVAHVEELVFESSIGRLETVYPHEEPLREWKIQAFVEGETLTLEIVTVESWGEFASGLLDELVDVMGFLVREPRAALFD